MQKYKSNRTATSHEFAANNGESKRESFQVILEIEKRSKITVYLIGIA